jgi:hypothetical protein
MKRLGFILFFIAGCTLTYKVYAQRGGGNPAGSAVRIGTSSSLKTTFTGGQTAVMSSVSVEHFHSISGNSLGNLVAATEGDAMNVVGGAMICQNLYCTTTNIAGTLTAAGGTDWLVAVDNNTVATALTCDITAALTSCSDTTHSFTTAAGDMLDFGWTPTGTPTAIVPHCSMDCYPAS